MTDKRQIVGPVLREPEAPASREEWEWHNYAAGAMTLTRKGGPSFTFIAASEFASEVEGDLNELRDYLNVLEADLAREREAHAATRLSERLYQVALAQAQGDLAHERVLREVAERERDEEKRLHEVNLNRAGVWAAKAGLATGRAETAEVGLADLQAKADRYDWLITNSVEAAWQMEREIRELDTLQSKYDALIPQFVQRVNQRANAEMMRTGVLEGAHRRAIDAELEAWLAAYPAPQTEAPGGIPGAE